MSLRLLPLFLTLLFSFATADEPSQNYTQALKLFQQGQVQEAKDLFVKSLEEQGPNAYVFYNLALAESKLGNEGVALALWRKALDLEPGLSRANEAIDFTIEKIKLKSLPHKITAWEVIRSRALVPLSLTSYLILTSFSFFLGGWFLLIYFGQVKRHEKKEGKTPKFPTLAIFLILIFLANVTLTTLKIIDTNTPRSTVISEKVDARTGPGPDQAILFELFEGIDVIVRESILKENLRWAQVTYPGGMTGWVPAETLMHSSGTAPW